MALPVIPVNSWRARRCAVVCAQSSPGAMPSKCSVWPRSWGWRAACSVCRLPYRLGLSKAWRWCCIAQGRSRPLLRLWWKPACRRAHTISISPAKSTCSKRRTRAMPRRVRRVLWFARGLVLTWFPRTASPRPWPRHCRVPHIWRWASWAVVASAAVRLRPWPKVSVTAGASAPMASSRRCPWPIGRAVSTSVTGRVRCTPSPFPGAMSAPLFSPRAFLTSRSIYPCRRAAKKRWGA